ncbi:peptidoglycan-associated lipoprotein Pal [Massilia sp. ST3]|uniref:peptidoglycan-associated lipoprotein Pal n=1 Tax=Massilia sp. ST3 TaxID=2824903 RepID=UPI001B821C34|nr:peptidoglycan-associated lipoprotein Pal [Massilia sp. ST3]MBQ5948744.1 peptidoglycan-associated lipoprotein Pal [Massilia sp. ST3]
MRNLKSVAFIVSAAALLAACSSPTKLNETPVVEKSPEPAPAQADTRDIKPVETGTVDPLNDPKGVLANRSVYFDYDSFVVRDDGRPVVENHSGYLNKNKERKVLIQGNTDERGGTEYNLALGQKRAEAVRRAMASLGVAEGQMEAVSLGEEKPKATGSNEAAWAENRRADIVYQ